MPYCKQDKCFGIFFILCKLLSFHSVIYISIVDNYNVVDPPSILLSQTFNSATGFPEWFPSSQAVRKEA
jgi:hypothetical protein